MGTVLIFARKLLNRELAPLTLEADGNQAIKLLLDELKPLLSEVKSSSGSSVDLSSSLSKVISLLEAALDKIDSVVGVIDRPEICKPIIEKVESARNELYHARRNAVLLESLTNG